MTRRVLRAAAMVAVLGGLLTLAPAATTAAAPRHDEVSAAEDSPAGVWASLVDLWDRLLNVISAGSGDDDGAASPPPPEGGSNTDEGPGLDPTG